MDVSPSAVRKFDKEGLLRRRDITFTRVGRELNFNCPFCADSRKRFFLNSSTGKGFCHNCGWASKRLAWFISSLTGVSIEQAERLIEGTPSGPVVRTLERKVDLVEVGYPPEHRFLKYPPSKAQEYFWAYLAGRNIPVSRALDYQIGYAREGRYAWRVFVPVYWEGKLVSWVARDVKGTQTPKVLTPLGNQESEYLLNLDRLWGSKELVLVEGPFDMLRIPDLAVASFGKRLSAAQVALLKKSGAKKIVIAYDDDASVDLREHGRRARESSLAKVWKQLRDWFQVYWVQMPPGEDPGSLPEPVMRSLVLEAKPLTLADIVRSRKGVTSTWSKELTLQT